MFYVCTYVFQVASVFRLLGSLMHFDSLALQNYYFLDPQWLCDLFAHVISTEYNCK